MVIYSSSLITKVTNYFGGDRTPTYQTTTYEYEGSLLVKEDWRLLDRSDDSVSDQYTITYYYDASGRIIKKEKDSDGNPITTNDIYTYTYGYGDSGLNSYQYSQAGETDAYTFTYNEQGQLTEKLLRETTSYNDRFVRETYAYDTESRLISVAQSWHLSETGPAYREDTTTYAYGDDGRLNGWTELAANGTDVTGKRVVELTYDEGGTSAAGTITDYSWDGISGEFVTDEPAGSLSFTFAAGVPTAAMEIPVALGNYYPAHDFEKITLSVKHPALIGVINSNPIYMAIPK